MTTKMKGLLKENEEEEEIQIGFPTDVKHVAHIGCDGPAANTPSWMDEFKSPTGISSSPVGSGETKEGPSELTTQDSVRSTTSFASCPSPGRDAPFLPKSSRSRRSTGTESGTKGKSEKTSSRHARRASKGSASGRDLGLDPALGSESPMRYPTPDVPKKSRRKKSKDSSGAEPPSKPSRSSKSQPSSSSNEPPLPDQEPDQTPSNMEGFEEMGDKRLSLTS